MPDLLNDFVVLVLVVLFWVAVAAILRHYHAHRLERLADLVLGVAAARAFLQLLLDLPWMLGGWIVLGLLLVTAYAIGRTRAETVRLRRMARAIEDAHPLATTESGPHDFTPVRGHPRLCQHCYAPRRLHPRQRYTRSRPLGDLSYYRADSARFHEEGSNW